MATVQAHPVIRCARHLAARLTDLSDRQLLERFASGRDELAFEALVRRHGSLVLGACLRILGDRHAAEDACQWTFLLLARKADCLQRPEALGPWLYGVATRTALKARSRRARLREVERLAAVCPTLERADNLVWQDIRPVLDEAIAGLSAKYREPFVLHHLQELTVAEIARRLGCPPGTVSARLARAREQLRARLTRRGLALSAGVLAATLSEGVARAWVLGPLVVSTVQAAMVATGQTLVAGAASASAAALVRAGGSVMVTLRVAVVLVAVGSAGFGSTVFAPQICPGPARAEGAAPPRTAASIRRAEAEKEFAKAEFYRRTGHSGSACFYYELVQRRYPETPAARRAGERLRELRKQATDEAEPRVLRLGCNDYGVVFEQVRKALGSRFKIVYANRYDGRIESEPVVVKPNLRHRATAQIMASDEGGFLVEVRVLKEIQTKAEWKPAGRDEEAERAILWRLITDRAGSGEQKEGP